jgi:cysteine synthase A
MTEAEIEIARSTPSARFDKAPHVPQVMSAEPLASDAARAFFTEVIASEEQKVVLFALEWCEFCWGVRKLLARCGIAYRAVDIDSVAYKRDRFGLQIRAALRERTGMSTIPQLFVGGDLVGGASETFAAYQQGRLQDLLRRHSVPFTAAVGDELYSLLPGWVQRR